MLVYSTDEKIHDSLRTCKGDVYVGGPKRCGEGCCYPIGSQEAEGEYWDPHHWPYVDCGNTWGLDPVTGLCPDCREEVSVGGKNTLMRKLNRI